MLICQSHRGSNEDDLFFMSDNCQHRPDRDSRLSTTDIPLDEPRHREPSLQILSNVADHLALGVGKFKWES